MRLSNKNRRIANYNYSSKSKKTKLSEHIRKEEADKKSDNEGEINEQNVKTCKTYRGKYKGEC